MAFTEKNYCNLVVTSGTDTLYTVPASTTSIIKNIHVVNTTATAATISLWIDIDSTTAGDAEAVLKGFNVPANDFISINTWIVMLTGSTAKATGGTNNAISIRLSGADIT